MARMAAKNRPGFGCSWSIRPNSRFRSSSHFRHARPARRDRFAARCASPRAPPQLILAQAADAIRFVRLVASSAMAPIVNDPSLNGGMNSPPMNNTAETDNVASTAVMASTMPACRSVICDTRASSIRFNQRSKAGSWACSRNFALGSKYDASTRRHRQRHAQRRQQRQQIRQPQRREHPPFEPSQREERHHDQHHDQCGVHDAIAHLGRGQEDDLDRIVRLRFCRFSFKRR